MLVKWATGERLENKKHTTWWRHQMETFSALLAICAGNSPVPGEFPTQRPVTRSFDVCYLRLNKRLSKQWWGWWFETLSRPLWRHRNELDSGNKVWNPVLIYAWWQHPLYGWYNDLKGLFLQILMTLCTSSLIIEESLALVHSITGESLQVYCVEYWLNIRRWI